MEYKDCNGVELKIGDTVEVVDEIGSGFFNGKKGQHFTVSSLDGVQLLGVKDSYGDYGAMYSFRFKKVNVPINYVGKKYNYRHNNRHCFFVYSQDADGVVIGLENFAPESRYYITFDNLNKHYTKVVDEEWVYLYKVYDKVISSAILKSEQEAKLSAQHASRIPLAIVKLNK